ncbi:pif-2 [Spodoptera frugiperda granulovirus]|uniref:Pif-2 n=1 Tax=Spodoptera frugiperda granulovirus TaxID=307454 RepID=A0A0C5AUU2_9BBAC|nr:pif-2 [Spodoptera frugiperda granulovirus]AJK91698.1 pif-2 [Spodoptera frugiperda granulovirus]AXS01057.1 pif-2 [Spodoptera frugiperda granulovirus]
MFWLLTSLFIILLYLIYTPLQRAQQQIQQDMIATNKTLDDPEYLELMKRRRYAPLHSLPRVDFNPSFETLDGANGGHCFSYPIRVSWLDATTYDCASLCDDIRAAYFYVGPYDTLIVDGRELQEGGYCTTNSVPRNCNRETSILLHSINQWTCIAEDPRYFAGRDGLVQTAGRQHFNRIRPGFDPLNVLWDTLLNRQVDPTVNTFRYSWDELKPDGTRRFEVRCNAPDDKGNLMFVNPLNPIECLPNVCTNVQFVHRSVMPNFTTGECECGDYEETRVTHLISYDKSSICVSVIDRWDERNRRYIYRVPCVSMDMPVNMYRDDMLLCPPGLINLNTDNAYEFQLDGVIPLSGNGIHEPTHQFYLMTRSRISWRDIYNIPT